MYKLISALIVYHHNVKMLHWTCKGKGFDATHEYLDNIAKQLDEYIDVVAEIMMSKGLTIPTLVEAVNVLEQDDDNEHLVINGSDTHNCGECAEATYRMFCTLYILYEAAHEGNESDIVSIFDEHMAWIRKEGFYKMKLRLSDN